MGSREIGLKSIHVSNVHLNARKMLRRGLRPLALGFRQLPHNEHYGYDLTIFPALVRPEYQIYSGDIIPGGIGNPWQKCALRFATFHILTPC